MVIISAGLISLMGRRIDPARFVVIKGHGEPEGEERAIDTMISGNAGHHTHASIKRALKVAAVWLSLWFTPLIALALTMGFNNVFTQIGLSKPCAAMSQ